MYRAMIWDEFLHQSCFRDEGDSGLSDEEQKREWPKSRPKHARKRYDVYENLKSKKE